MKKDKHLKEEIPDFLRALKKENPFITPHNYFRELPDEIMLRIKQESQKPASPSTSETIRTLIRSLFTLRPAWVLALVIVISAIFFFDVEKQPDSVVSSEGGITSKEVAAYIQLHLDEFDEDDFYTSEVADIDLLGEALDPQEVEPFFESLMDDIDLETIQRIF